MPEKINPDWTIAPDWTTVPVWILAPVSTMTVPVDGLLGGLGLEEGGLTGLVIVFGLSQTILYQVVPAKYLRKYSSNQGENRPLVSNFLIHSE